MGINPVASRVDPTARRRCVGKILISAVLASGLAAGLAGLPACSSKSDKAPRPLTDAELSRLSSMRQRNFNEGDGRVGIRGTVGQQGTQTSVNGWIDWRRGLIYLSVSSTAQGSVALVQAKPGVLAIRPETNKSPTGDPPKQPPPDGWRVRPISLSDKTKTPLDNLLAFLFLLAREKADRPDLLKKISTQWVRRDATQNTEVDVILGPAAMPEFETPQPSASASASASAVASPGPQPNPSSLDTHGGAVGYWLDADGRLRKLETLLAANMPTNIELIRDDHTDIPTVAALGGRDVSPREVTDPEAEMLSLMRQRNFHARQAQLTLTLPAMPGTLRHGTGWLDWQRSISYLSVHDLDDAESNSLVLATKTKVAKRKPDASDASGKPPIPLPKDKWESTPWGGVNGDVDFILFECMSMALNQRDDVKRMKTLARRLRVEVLNGVPMGVFELPNALEQKWAPGTARVRYWLDNSGILRRVEIRTATGGFAQLDITPAQIPSNLPTSVP